MIKLYGDKSTRVEKVFETKQSSEDKLLNRCRGVEMYRGQHGNSTTLTLPQMVHLNLRKK